MAPKANPRKRKAQSTAKSSKKPKSTSTGATSSAAETSQSQQSVMKPHKILENSSSFLQLQQQPASVSNFTKSVNPLDILLNPPVVLQAPTSLWAAPATTTVASQFQQAKADAEKSELFMPPSPQPIPAMPTFESLFAQIEAEEAHRAAAMRNGNVLDFSLPTDNATTDNNDNVFPNFTLPIQNATTGNNSNVFPAFTLPIPNPTTDNNGHAVAPNLQVQIATTENSEHAVTSNLPIRAAPEPRQPLEKPSIKQAIDSEIWDSLQEDLGMMGFNKLFNEHIKPLIERQQANKFERILRPTDDPEAYRKKCMDEWRAAREARQAAEANPPPPPTPINDVVGMFATTRPLDSTSPEPGIVIKWPTVLEMYFKLPAEAKNTRAGTYKVLEMIVTLEQGLKHCNNALRSLADDVTAMVTAFNDWVDTFNAAAPGSKASTKVKKAESGFYRLRTEASATCAKTKNCCMNVDGYGRKLADVKRVFADKELKAMILYLKKKISMAEMEAMVLGA